MPVHCQYVADGDYVEIRYVGVVPPDVLLSSARQVLDLGRERGTPRVLTDTTMLEAGHSIVDLYGMLELLQEQVPSRNFKEALIMPRLQASARDVAFWETGCRNRGFNVRVFADRETARAWLCETP